MSNLPLAPLFIEKASGYTEPRPVFTIIWGILVNTHEGNYNGT
jgi:hypothetical protein